jgi:hypothetical protein
MPDSFHSRGPCRAGRDLLAARFHWQLQLSALILNASTGAETVFILLLVGGNKVIGSLIGSIDSD